MIFQIIQYSIVSLIIIFIFHYLISHLTDNLTTPQVRDLVSSTNQNYENIIKKIEKSSNSNKKESTENMKDDLKTYLNTLNNSTSSLNINSNNLSTQQSFNTNLPNMSNNKELNLEYESVNNDELAYSTY
jgi:putative cell wall-binding protein